MPVATAAETVLYLYGITRANSPEIDTPGVEGGAVEKVIEGEVAAVVSRVATTKIRPRRANLSAHHQVLRRLTAANTVLPMTFGTLAESEAELRDLLDCNYDELLDLLQRLEGKIEMGLKVYWDTENVFEYFVANHEELATLRNRLFRPGRQATRDEKIKLGMLFEEQLAQSRQRHTQRVVEALSPYCAEIRTVDPGEERMVMKLACLVGRGLKDAWEDGVMQVAKLFNDHYCFTCSGPFAPHCFAEIELSRERKRKKAGAF